METENSLKKKYLQLHTELKDKLEEIVANKDLESISKHINALQDLRPEIRSTSELLHDNEQVRLVSETSLKVSKRLFASGADFTTESFLATLAKTLENTRSMVSFKTQHLPTFYSPPPRVNFLGRLLFEECEPEALPKKKTKPQKVAMKLEDFDSDKHFSKPKETNEGSLLEENEKTQTDQRVKELFERLHNKKVQNLYQFVSADSFNKTVENIFDLMFLVKGGQAFLNMKNGEPVVLSSSLKYLKETELRSRQAVLSVDLEVFDKIKMYLNELSSK